MYYNYHGIIKRKIEDGLLLRYEIVQEYKKIKPALVLYFMDDTVYPIREYKWYLYLPYLQKLEINE